jgi:hypothetical protein
MLAICKHKEHMPQAITYIFASAQPHIFVKNIIIMDRGQDEPFQTLNCFFFNLAFELYIFNVHD